MVGGAKQRKANKASKQEAAQATAQQQQQQEAETKATCQQGIDTFKRAFSACMDACGYSIALPLLIDVNGFRPKIESELTNAMGRQVTLGKLSLSILRGRVGVDDVSIADDPAFSKSPFITAKSLKVGVELLPLIFSKQLNMTEIVLEEPQISLLKSANGTWNFSSLGGTSSKNSPEQAKSGASQSLSIAKLEIIDGKLAVGKAHFTAKPQVYDKLNIELKNFSSTSQFPFKLTINLPGGGSANLTGKAGPINPQDSAKTPFDATIKVKDMDIAGSGFLDPASWIGGSADFDGSLNSNGSQAKATGAITCEKLKLSPKGSPAPRAVAMKYAMNTDLDQETGNITQGDIAIGKAVARLTGGFRTQGQTQVMNLKLTAPDMSVDELEPMLPALGVVLPSGSKLKGGNAVGRLGNQWSARQAGDCRPGADVQYEAGGF
jgi:AsmA protein